MIETCKITEIKICSLFWGGVPHFTEFAWFLQKLIHKLLLITVLSLHVSFRKKQSLHTICWTNVYQNIKVLGWSNQKRNLNTKNMFKKIYFKPTKFTHKTFLTMWQQITSSGLTLRKNKLFVIGTGAFVSLPNIPSFPIEN